MGSPSLRILLIDDSPVRTAIVQDGLRETDGAIVEAIPTSGELTARVQAIDPDVVIIGMEDPSRDILEQVFDMSREARRPIAMFVDRSDDSMIHSAIEAGVSAYVVNGLARDRVRPIVEMAISRFHAFEKLRAELEEAKTALSERRLIDRAKGILMKSRGLEEEEAYNLLRRTAMNEKKRIAEIAQSVIIASKLGV